MKKFKFAGKMRTLNDLHSIHPDVTNVKSIKLKPGWYSVLTPQKGGYGGAGFQVTKDSSVAFVPLKKKKKKSAGGRRRKYNEMGWDPDRPE